MVPTLRWWRGRSSSTSNSKTRRRSTISVTSSRFVFPANNHRPFPIHQDHTPYYVPLSPQWSGRSYFSSYSTTHVQKGMDRWINEFVMMYKICPYAKGSSYSIQVWSHHELETKGSDCCGAEESILDFCHQHVPRTLPPPSPTRTATTNSTDGTATTSVLYRPNVFLCFPNVPDFNDYLSFFGFYQALMHVLPHVAGDNNNSGGGAPACHHSDENIHNQWVWQSFVFHPHYVDMVTDQPNLRFRAPFPSLHFIPLADLQQQRQKQPKKSLLSQQGSRRTTTTTTMSKAIFQRNVITLQQSNVVATLQQILQDAREDERRID